MPRKWSGYKPNPNLRDEGIVKHLKKVGVDPGLFGRFVKIDAGSNTMQKFFPKPDGTYWTRKTITTWKKLYREQEL